MTDQQNLNGILNLNKPSGITSRDAVNQVQTWYPRKTRIGHTGTLDPLADGVLVLCVGQATRVVEYVQNMDKVYETEIMFGAVSDTDDAQGTISTLEVSKPPTLVTVNEQLPQFLGEIQQVPPQFSALKVNGRRAYKLARKGEPVSIQPRTVHVYDIEIMEYHYPLLALRIHCGKGTYIRSIARDLGQTLGCGGFVKTLRRVRVGPFTYAEAISLDMQDADTPPKMMPLEMALQSLPRISITDQQAGLFCLGTQQLLYVRDGTDPKSGIERTVYLETGEFIGIGILRDNVLQPSKVFAKRPQPL